MKYIDCFLPYVIIGILAVLLLFAMIWVVTPILLVFLYKKWRPVKRYVE